MLNPESRIPNPESPTPKGQARSPIIETMCYIRSPTRSDGSCCRGILGILPTVHETVLHLHLARRSSSLPQSLLPVGRSLCLSLCIRRYSLSFSSYLD